MTGAAPGSLVAFEGASGTGKTTLSRLVAHGLGQHRPVLMTREPSEGPLGRAARDGTHDYRGAELACLVTADRLHHLRTTVLPALDDGAVVVCDRYVLSSLVLQQLDGVDRDYIAAINAPARRPELYVVLSAPVETAVARVRARGTTSRLQPADSAEADREHRLYEAETTALEATGQAVLRVPATGTDPEALAARLIGDILDRLRD